VTAGRGSVLGDTSLSGVTAVGRVPARVLAGFASAIHLKKRTTIFGSRRLWRSLGPDGPPTGICLAAQYHLALIGIDLPLLNYTKQYRSIRVAIRRDSGRALLQTNRACRIPEHRLGARYESEHVQTIAAYVDHLLPMLSS